MPEVAKICSEQYQKLSDKKKARYKQRCDEMRRQYDTRLANFYEEHPTLRPVKPDKAKKALAAKQLKQKAQEALQEQQQAAQQAAQQQAAQQQAAQQQVAQQQAAQQQAQQQLQQQQMQQQQQQQQQQLQQQIQIQQPQFIQNGQPPQGAVQVVQNGQPMMVQNIVQTTNAAGEPIYMVQQTPMQPQPQQQQPQPRPMTALPPPPVLAHAGMTIQAQSPLPLQTPLPPHALQQGTSTPTPPPLPQAPQAIPVTLPVTLPQQPHTQQQLNQQYQVASASSQANVTSSASGVAASVFSSAPERPAKPFDLYFKAQMDAHAGDTNFDRQSCAEKYRAEWKTMKVKKKAKWIKKAVENYREYEEKVADFMVQNPGYVRPAQKNFLTQEEQRILDKFMGRPEKPPSSAYSLFSKEMLNNVEIKKFPSKDRMAQISEKWKLLPQEQKDNYQAEVNRSMGVYRQKYEDWFNNLSDTERKAETARMNSTKSIRKAPVTKVAGATPVQEPKIVNVPSNVTPAGPAFSLANLTPVMVQPQMSMMQQPVAMQVIPGKDRQQLLDDILKREPVEPARSPKQLFISEWLTKHKKKKPSDAKDRQQLLDDILKREWDEKLEPQRQKYIEDYTVFVRGLDKEELEMYTELKQKRDEEEENQNDSSDSDSDSDSDDSDSDSDSDSDI